MPALLPSAGRLAALAIMAVALMAPAAPPAHATNIERLVTPGGIEVWMVRDATVPLVAMDFSFRGGANQDPSDKPGIANMAVDLLDEGAGELDSKAFKDRLERRAIKAGRAARSPGSWSCLARPVMSASWRSRPSSAQPTPRSSATSATFFVSPPRRYSICTVSPGSRA